MSAEELPLIDQVEPRSTSVDARPDAAQGLTLASVSRDGRRMLLVDASGREFTVEVDERLRAALPADSPRRQETPVTTPLRPKDIQTRIRGGESAEDVAAAGGTTVEKIMPFAAPVLAEREHMAVRAQKGSVRRRPGEPAGTARTLGAAVAARLGAYYLEPDSIAWDSFRRPDGRWTVQGTFTTPDRNGTAAFIFDVAGNYVSADSDDARWLIGEQVEEPVAIQAPDELYAARQRRAGSAPEMPGEQDGPAIDSIDAEQPVEAFLISETVVETVTEVVVAPEPSVGDDAEPVAEAPDDQPAPAPEKPRSSRRKRASVPSWDEIMFGGGKGD